VRRPDPAADGGIRCGRAQPVGLVGLGRVAVGAAGGRTGTDVVGGAGAADVQPDPAGVGSPDSEFGAFWGEPRPAIPAPDVPSVFG